MTALHDYEVLEVPSALDRSIGLAELMQVIVLSET
jgi:hypothetical protein